VSCLCDFINNCGSALRSGTVELSASLADKGWLIVKCTNPPSGSGTTCLALSDLLGGHPENSLSRMERFGIASAAAWAVLYLCGTPWLAEVWPGSSGIELDVRAELTRLCPSLPVTPTISCLLKSREASPAEASRQQKQPWSSGGVRNRILFGLGVLLIELCLDATLSDLRQTAFLKWESRRGTTSEGTTSEIDYELLTRCWIVFIRMPVNHLAMSSSAVSGANSPAGTRTSTRISLGSASSTVVAPVHVMYLIQRRGGILHQERV